MKTFTSDQVISELRKMASQILSPGSGGWRLAQDAASEIEELHAENAKLKKALQEILSHKIHADDDDPGRCAIMMQDIADAALDVKAKPKGEE